MSEKGDIIPVSIREETIILAGMTVKTHILENGQRIIEADDFETLMELLGFPPLSIDPDSGDQRRLVPEITPEQVADHIDRYLATGKA